VKVKQRKMWKLKAFVVLIGTLWISGVAESFTIPDETETEILSQALVRIAKEIIAPINKTVNIFTCDGVGNRLNNLPKYLMKDLNNTMTFTNEYRMRFSELRAYQNSYHYPASLVICEEWNIVEDNLHYRESFETKLGHITYVTTEAAERYINAVREHGKILRPKTLLLVNDGDYLDLKVAALISESSCENLHLRTINRFSKRTRQWLKPSFDMVKLRSNNHGCPFSIMAFADSPEIIWPGNKFGEGTNKYSELSGYYTRIIKELSRRLNFSIHDGMSAFPYDLTLSSFSKEFDESAKKKAITDMIQIYREVFVVVPLGEFYSGFEKLFLPFDYATWILIAMTFAIGLMTILIVTQLSMTIRNFVVGRDVRAPTMNLLAAIFGLGQTRLPGRNFARFLLMLYILWCLIIRTGYQGVLYDLLKGDGRKPQNMQLQDFIDNNATLHMNVFCSFLLPARPQFERFDNI